MSMAVVAAMIAFASCGNNTKKAEEKVAETTEQCCAEGCCKEEGCCKDGACTEQECAECTECTECPDCPAGESAE